MIEQYISNFSINYSIAGKYINTKYDPKIIGIII
jgi:hypothetical protein